MDTIPKHVYDSAKSDLNYLLSHVNSNNDLDANLLHMSIEIEDGDDLILDVSVKSTISFGYDPRQQIEFEFDYYVNGDRIKFWNHSDIDTVAVELQHRIDDKRGRRK